MRLSAMGDVIMLVQSIRNILASNESIEITLITKKPFDAFFENHPRLRVKVADIKNQHKGLFGLRRLFKEIKSEEFDFFIDQHYVLRSRVIGKMFSMNQVPVFRINKDRKSKNDIISGNAPLKRLKSGIQRYNDTFEQVGLKTSRDFKYSFPSKPLKESHKIIGIAPFAAHESKEWGEKNILSLINLLNQHQSLKIKLFGGGLQEINRLDNISSKFENCINLAGKMNLNSEINEIASCDVFLAMDSSNMHLASLVGVPTVSVWVSTHPYLGFAPFNNEQFCIVPDKKENPKHPFSVFGKIEHKKTLPLIEKARNSIKPEEVYNMLKQFLV